MAAYRYCSLSPALYAKIFLNPISLTSCSPPRFWESTNERVHKQLVNTV